MHLPVSCSVCVCVSHVQTSTATSSVSSTSTSVSHLVTHRADSGRGVWQPVTALRAHRRSVVTWECVAAAGSGGHLPYAHTHMHRVLEADCPCRLQGCSQPQRKTYQHCPLRALACILRRMHFVQTHTPTSSETSSATSTHSVGASSSVVSARNVSRVGCVTEIDTGRNGCKRVIRRRHLLITGIAITPLTSASIAAATVVQTGTGSWTATSTQVCAFADAAGCESS